MARIAHSSKSAIFLSLGMAAAKCEPASAMVPAGGKETMKPGGTLVVEFKEGSSSRSLGLPEAVAEADWIARGTLLAIGPEERSAPNKAPQTWAWCRVRLEEALKGHPPQDEVRRMVFLHHIARHYRAPMDIIRTTLVIGSPVVVFDVPVRLGDPRINSVESHIESDERLPEIRQWLRLYQNPAVELENKEKTRISLFFLTHRVESGDHPPLSGRDIERLRSLVYEKDVHTMDEVLWILASLREVTPASMAVYRRAVRMGRIHWIEKLGGKEGLELGMEAFREFLNRRDESFKTGLGLSHLLDFLGAQGDEAAGRAMREAWPALAKDNYLVELIEATLAAGKRFPKAAWAQDLPEAAVRALRHVPMSRGGSRNSGPAERGDR